MKQLIILLLLSLSLQAQKKDIKIGLVLSGGGAKCMAQIGALKVMEEAGIKFDYIGGTSMGAIVGAMYSLGYSAAEIELYLKNVNWDALLSNEIPRNRLSFFDRKADSRYLLRFPIDNNGINIPKGVNFAQYIMKELSTITQQSYPYLHFSELPIPFFCVATNLESGQMRVFEHGRLIDALRASSAFPSLFTPYLLEDSLYIDGGVLNNFPVQIMAEKGLDYIIGVDMQDYLNSREDLNSVVKVMAQTSAFLNAQNRKESEALTDIWMTPKIEGASITSFDIFEEIVAAGEAEARAHWDELVALAEMDGGPPQNPEKAIPLSEFFVKEIQVNGLQNLTPDFVKGKLRVRENKICEVSKLDKGLDQLYGTQYFTNIDYTLVPADTGYILNINLREKEYSQQLNVGINYSDDYNAALLLNYTNRKLFFKNSKLSVDLALGDMPRGEISYFVDRGFIPTLGLKLRSHRFKYSKFQNRLAVNEKTYQDYSLQLFLQSTWRDAYAIGGGVEVEDISINQSFESSTMGDFQKAYINYFAFLDFDSFDDANFPRTGFQLNMMYRIIAEREGFEIFREPSSVLDINLKQAVGLGPKWSMLLEMFGATAIGPSLDEPYQIYLGSQGQAYINYMQPFVGYRFLELSGNNALTLRADFRYEFLKNNYIKFKANYGRVENSFEDLFNSDVLLDGYSIGYSYNSLIGPLELNLAASSNHPDLFAYVRLGFWF